MVGGWELGLPTSGSGDGRSGRGGGGALNFPPPEHSRTVCCNQTHYRSVSGSRVVPRSTGFPEVVGTGMSVPVGDAYGVKGGGDGRDGGGGIWRQARINRGVTVATEYIRDGV